MKRIFIATAIFSHLFFLQPLFSDEAVPWGAMYTPNEHLTHKGMTGAVKYYRGSPGANQLLIDLSYAYAHEVKLIITLGSVAPGRYLDKNNDIDMASVRKELNHFFIIADELQPYIDNGTIWGIRFMDEPHNPSGYPRGFEVNATQLGSVFELIKAQFKDVRTGSTSPPYYMSKVPRADFTCCQYNNSHPPRGYTEAMPFFKEQADIAFSNGLDFVASFNANMNEIGNLEFFSLYNEICSLEHVDFITSWQWPQGKYSHPSFESRFNDPDRDVQSKIAEIPYSCKR